MFNQRSHTLYCVCIVYWTQYASGTMHQYSVFLLHMRFNVCVQYTMYGTACLFSHILFVDCKCSKLELYCILYWKRHHSIVSAFTMNIEKIWILFSNFMSKYLYNYMFMMRFIWSCALLSITAAATVPTLK